MPEPAHKRQLILTVYATPLMTLTTALGLSIRLSIFELRETGDWDIFLAVHQSIFIIFTSIVLFSLYPTSADPRDYGVEILRYLRVPSTADAVA